MARRPGSPGFDPGRLRQVRTERGLTQAQLAEMVGVDRPMVSQWESREGTPLPANLVALAEALEVPADQLCVRGPASARLSDLRVWRGLTLVGAADQADIDPGGLIAYEKGTRQLPGAQAGRLAELYGVDIAVVQQAAERSQQAPQA